MNTKMEKPKSIVMRVNMTFIAFVITSTVVLFLLLKSHANVTFLPTNCSIRNCTTRKINGGISNKITKEETLEMHKSAPSFLQLLINGNAKVGLVNMRDNEPTKWGIQGGEYTNVTFDRVSNKVKWDELFPYWVDEDENFGIPKCPDVPLPDFSKYEKFDIVMAELPCQRPKDGWNRDVFRLQVNLVTAKLAVETGKRDDKGAVKMAFFSKCEPMRDIFRCEDLVMKEGDWWVYDADVAVLEEKLQLPVGSCELAFAPLWRNMKHNKTKPYEPTRAPNKREAYATVLHSSDKYICGAITLAYTLRKTGSTRDLILLHDSSINPKNLQALISARWAPRLIERIRNPHAKNGTYNEYNYTKFRLWQLTDYDKIIFIDSDITILRNIDFLFGFPKMSARSNDMDIFNSGLLVLEPSNCTYETMISNIENVISYNGGDQGFLNEMFVWWHRLPNRISYLKMNTSEETNDGNNLLENEISSVYTIHYLGKKPWTCYRDYDCNWDVEWIRRFANDEAFFMWWKVYDEMDEGLRSMCNLSEKDKEFLDRHRNEAKSIGYSDEHWKINITDPRKEA